MAERESAINIPAAEEMFKTDSDRITDARDGAGERLDLGSAHLEFYPDSSIVRYKDQSIMIEMLGVTSAKAVEQWFRIESEGVTRDTLSFHPESGTIMFAREPLTGKRPETPIPAAPKVPEKREIREDLSEVTGNIGFSQLTVNPKSGKPRFTFTLFENFTDGRPSNRHQVVAWDDLAMELSKEVSQGDYVKVSGKFHTRQVKGADKVELTLEQWQTLRKKQTRR